MTFEIPVYLIINSEYSKIKKLKKKTLYLLLIKLFFDFFLIKRKEHNNATSGIYIGRTILLFKTVLISFFVPSLQFKSVTDFEPNKHCTRANVDVSCNFGNLIVLV